MVRGFCLLFFIFIAANAQGTSSIYPEYQWQHGGIYATSYFQKKLSGNSNSLLLLYSPRIKFENNWSLITDIGGAYLNTETSKFLAIHLGIRGEYRFSNSFSSDLTLGAQDWVSQGGFLGMGGVAASYHFETPLFTYIDSIRGGVQHVGMPDYPTWQYILGFEFDIGKSQESSLPISEPVPEPLPKPIITIQSAPPPLKVATSLVCLHFNKDEATLGKDGEVYLTELAKLIVEHEDEWRVIEITGHTDSRGTIADNEQLSKHRAQTARDIFIRTGASFTKIHFRGVGSTEPVDTSDNKNAWKRNRRIEIRFKDLDNALAISINDLGLKMKDRCSL